MHSLGAAAAIIATGAAALALGACGGQRAEPVGSEPEPVIVHYGALRQHISGFGASSAWTAPVMPESLADEFFSAETGIGLSLVRVRIAPDGTTGEMEAAEQAMARGARVWASPWSPPGAWKTNGDAENGGQLLPERYQDWAESLASFAAEMEAAELPLVALSAQNEPDYEASWETCLWSPEELAGFVADHLAPALERAGVSTPVIAPEASGWRGIERYSAAIVDNPAAAAAVSFLATHAYNGSPFEFELPETHGKELWMTEVSDDKTPGGTTGMESGLWVARWIHDDLTIANVSAWHYWWLIPRTDAGADPNSNSALLFEGQMTRRGHVLGQYSRFVRPGSHRVETSTDRPQRGVFVTAFRNDAAESVIVVALNTGDGAVEQRFELDGVRAESIVPWVTDETRAIVAGAPLEGGDGFDYELPPGSVTTFVASVTAE